MTRWILIELIAACSEARWLGSITADVRAPGQGGTVPNGSDPFDHGVSSAHGNIGLGANARVAVFDTGVDLDQTGHQTSPNPDPHHALRDWSGNSRATHQLVEPIGVGIDCNTTTPAVDPYCPNQNNNLDARHGTGVSGIAVGREDPNTSTNWYYRGHAPEAKVLSYAISWPDPGNDPTKNWPTYETTMIKVVQQLATYILTSWCSKPPGLRPCSASSAPTCWALDWREALPPMVHLVLRHGLVPRLVLHPLQWRGDDDRGVTR